MCPPSLIKKGMTESCIVIALNMNIEDVNVFLSLVFLETKRVYIYLYRVSEFFLENFQKILKKNPMSICPEMLPN